VKGNLESLDINNRCHALFFNNEERFFEIHNIDFDEGRVK
jgi:hypothetical protein